MPDLSRLYREIADRHMLAARLTLANGLHEIAVFHAYHAFESIACAALGLRSLPIPMRHESKLTRFIRAHRRLAFVHGASALGTRLWPLRNKVLYPEQQIGPRDSITLNEASQIVSRVGGLIREIAQALRLQ
jgi:hypothetical protein